jgi:hypothetical protein
MKNVWILRALAALVIATIAGWIVHNTKWVEVDVDEPPRGAAAADPYYSLRQVLAASGSTLEIRASLEPLPPAGATLVLNSSLWTVFPERDARLKAWVEAGGDLVVDGWRARDGETLKWIPLSFAEPPKPRPAASAASAADADEDDDADTPPPPPRDGERRTPPPGNPRRAAAIDPLRHCASLVETDATTQPAFEPGRVYRGCLPPGPLRPLHVTPAWQLSGPNGMVAMRVPVGRGTVTATAVRHAIDDNRGLLQADNALVASAILRAGPGRAVWVVNDESREPLPLWLWHQARTPLLLGVAATLLALWRLMVRFGPRQALPPRARRSMGEQVRGTGQFIAGADPQALHAATRQAFDDAARLRIEDYAQLTDSDRIHALAALLAPAAVLDKEALMAALRPGPKSTPAQWLAAISLIEQARRSLLRASTPAARAADGAGHPTP